MPELNLPSDGTRVEAMCMESIEYDRESYRVTGTLRTVLSPFGPPPNCWVGDLPVDPESVRPLEGE
jgi:hypothetical protein